MVSSRVAAIHFFAAFLPSSCSTSWLLCGCCRPSSGLTRAWRPSPEPVSETCWKMTSLFYTHLPIRAMKENAYFPLQGLVDSTKSLELLKQSNRCLGVQRFSSFDLNCVYRGSWGTPRHEAVTLSVREGEPFTSCFPRRKCCLFNGRWSKTRCSANFMEVQSTSPRSHRNKYVLLERANKLPWYASICKSHILLFPCVFLWRQAEFHVEWQSRTNSDRSSSCVLLQTQLSVNKRNVRSFSVHTSPGTA